MANVFTSATAPAAAPSLAEQIYAPDSYARSQALMRQQRLADMLRAQAMEPAEGTQVINGWAVPNSPIAPLAKALAGFGAGYRDYKNDAEQHDIARDTSQAYMKALGGMLPGAPAATPGTVPPPDAGTAPPPSNAGLFNAAIDPSTLAATQPESAQVPPSGPGATPVAPPDVTASPGAPPAAPAPAPAPPPVMPPAGTPAGWPTLPPPSFPRMVVSSLYDGIFPGSGTEWNRAQMNLDVAQRTPTDFDKTIAGAGMTAEQAQKARQDKVAKDTAEAATRSGAIRWLPDGTGEAFDAAHGVWLRVGKDGTPVASPIPGASEAAATAAATTARRVAEAKLPTTKEEQQNAADVGIHNAVVNGRETATTGAVIRTGKTPDGTPVRLGASLGAEAEANATAQGYAKQAQEIDEAANAAKLGNSRLDEIHGLVINPSTHQAEFTPGAMAPIAQKLGSWALALGMSPDAVKEHFGNISNMTALGKETIGLAFEQAKSLTNRPAAAEVLLTAKNNPNIELPPEALTKVMEYMKGVNAFQMKKQQDKEAWIDSHDGSLKGFDAYFNRTTDINSMVPSLADMRAAFGMDANGREIESGRAPAKLPPLDSYRTLPATGPAR